MNLYKRKTDRYPVCVVTHTDSDAELLPRIPLYFQI
jgi:hypothetical protein